MRIFLDANVLVSVLNNEYPQFTYTSRVLSLADNVKFTVYTSALSLAIAFYFAEKKSGTTIARNKIALLAEKLNIANIGPNEVGAALQEKRAYDFEDGMQYFAAVNSHCKVIVTQDTRGFYYSDLQVLNAEDFINKHVLPTR
jgi:predicted nucleic acid-binding protein